MPGAKYEIKRKCEECGAVFLAKTLESRYCSRKCSNAAYHRRKKEKEQIDKLNQKVGNIPDARDYISVSEASALFGVNRMTIYRLIRLGELPSINIGAKLTRISKSALLEKYPVRTDPVDKNIALPKLYSLEPENCYTIGEIHEKYGISESTVYKAIRQHAIPTRQIGKYVYAPKSEIDTLFK